MNEVWIYPNSDKARHFIQFAGHGWPISLIIPISHQSEYSISQCKAGEKLMAHAYIAMGFAVLIVSLFVSVDGLSD